MDGRVSELFQIRQQIPIVLTQREGSVNNVDTRYICNLLPRQDQLAVANGPWHSPPGNMVHAVRSDGHTSAVEFDDIRFAETSWGTESTGQDEKDRRETSVP